MKKLNLLGSFLGSFFSFSRPPAVIKFFLANSLQGITQGVGILFLIPLLQLLDSSGGSGNKVARIIYRGFEALNLPVNIYSIVVVYVLLVSLLMLVSRYQAVLSATLTQSYTTHLRTLLFNRISSARWEFIRQRQRHSLIHSLTQDIGQAGATTFFLLKLISSSIIILFNVVVAILLAPWFSLATLVFAAVLLYVSRPLLRKAQDTGERARDYFQRIYNNITEMLTGLKNIKSHNLEEDLQDDFHKVSGAMEKEIVDFSRTRAGTTALHSIVSVILLGAYFIMAVSLFSIPLATLVVLVVLFGRLVPRFSGMFTSWQNVMNAVPAYQGLQQLLQQAEDNREELGSTSSEKVKLSEEIKINKLRYDYSQDFSLKDISMTIPAGKIVALAGNSGSGKTTLADLIAGLLNPAEGEIKIDDNPLDRNMIASWRNSLSYITQEPYLFNGSIRANLLFGVKREVDEEELWKVLETAGLSEKINSLGKRLDALVGEQGGNLSGGEKQRLVIARSLLMQPQLLILDEATSALDYPSENKIYQALQQLRGKTTVIIIAHRLSTIKFVDHVFVLKNGHLVEKGTWGELRDKKKGELKYLLEKGENQEFIDSGNE